MSSKRTILILSFTNLVSDPRVNRQIRLLKEHYNVVCAGTTSPEFDDVRFIPLPQKQRKLSSKVVAGVRLLLRRYQSFYWRQQHVIEALSKLENVSTDVVLANDLETLPLAIQIAGSVPLILDAHEYAALEFEEKLLFRILFKPYFASLYRDSIPKASAMLTVCDKIAEEYDRETGVKPHVMFNAPDFDSELSPQPVARDGRPFRLIHHGAAISARKMELLIDVVKELDSRFELDLMLVEGTPGYLDWLKQKAADCPQIRFRQPVPMPELPKTINEYDIGLCLLPPTNFNHIHALPNKFFEFIQARLALAIGPSPEMVKIVRKHELGVVADDFSPQSLASQINALDADKIMHYKQNSHRVAWDLSAEKSKQTLLSVVESVLK